ncbi:DUF2946 family protein [Flexibacterium corallicola]|uniref:DUF2946 family protein n=1 Tax=Flexibacterium corallicola TaxID=3037259 RepID=UPI00286EBB19|nr:DUF2946 family protein [Pseudovibrio sp. M1P-2-3]
MFNRWLTYLAYAILALTMTLSGVKAELLRSAGASADGVQEIVICTTLGQKTIQLDQNGDPIPQNQSDRSCCEGVCIACGMCQSSMFLPPENFQLSGHYLHSINPNRLRDVTAVRLVQSASARAPPGGNPC